MNKKISLKDIASAVGVSTALVSYVLNNKKEGRIKKTVAEKIRQTALAMNYRTNQIARSLKTSKTYTLGLILADISNPFSAELARAIEDAAERSGYTVIFGSSDENPEKYKKTLDALLNRQVDGLMLSPPEHAEQQIRELLQQQVPFVLVDRYFPDVETSYVVLDNYKAAFEATLHLSEQGYKNIGMINYHSALFHLQQRSQGYLDAIAASGLPFKPGSLQEVNSITIQEDTEKAVQALMQHTAADALLFGSNIIAKHAVQYLNRKGFLIPRDAALVSFDETDAFDLFYAPLSCIRQPMKEMGERAVDILLNHIDNGQASISQISLEGRLIVKASSYG